MKTQYLKSIITSLFFVISTTISFAQTAHTNGEYLSFVKRFYKIITSNEVVTVKGCSSFFNDDLVAEYEESVFETNCKKKNIADNDCNNMFKKHYYHDLKSASVFFLEIRKLKSKLTQDLNSSEIDKLITDSSKLIDIGKADFVLVKVNLPGKRFAYFSLNKYGDEKITIVDIFLSDGQSFLNQIIPNMSNFLTLPGKVNDPDGFVNVRNQASSNSTTIGKLRAGDNFYYTQTGLRLAQRILVSKILQASCLRNSEAINLTQRDINLFLCNSLLMINLKQNIKY